jgi:hypothetical protein
VRALQYFQRPLEVARVGECAAIGAEQRRIVGIVQGGCFQNGRRLPALAGRAQCLRVADRNVGIAWVGAEAIAECIALATPVVLGPLLRAGGNRTRRVGRPDGFAAAE